METSVLLRMAADRGLRTPPLPYLGGDVRGLTACEAKNYYGEGLLWGEERQTWTSEPVGAADYAVCHDADRKRGKRERACPRYISVGLGNTYPRGA
jgi:hypothetical protein